jgi:hypothetical protein
MFSKLHERFGTAGLAVAVIALVAALGGTALAAKGALTSKQKKEVEKIAKKFAGKPGPPGPAGPAGAQGPAGPAGPQGAAGKDGSNGTNGTNGATGATGATGKGTTGATGVTGTTGTTGSPWVVGTAPTGAVLKGTWSIQQYTAAGAGEVVRVPISTGVPVNISEAKALMFQKGTNLPGEETAEREFKEESCPGSADNALPSIHAEPPFNLQICVYIKEASNLAAPPVFIEELPLTGSGGGVAIEMKSNAAGTTKAYGSWSLVAK